MRGVKGHELRLTYLEMLQVTSSGLGTGLDRDRASKTCKKLGHSVKLGNVLRDSKGWQGRFSVREMLCTGTGAQLDKQKPSIHWKLLKESPGFHSNIGLQGGCSCSKEHCPGTGQGKQTWMCFPGEGGLCLSRV